MLSSRLRKSNSPTSFSQDGISSSKESSRNVEIIYSTPKDDKYSISLDVKDFKPDELSIRSETSPQQGGYSSLIIEGKSSNNSKKNSSSKQFQQTFSIPPEVDIDKMTSSLSSTGRLTVTAPNVTKGRSGSPYILNQASTSRISPSFGSSSRHNSSLLEPSSLKSGREIVTRTKSSGSHDNFSDKTDGEPQMGYNKDKFEIKLQCGKYKPEQLDVRLEENNDINDKVVIVTGKQEFNDGPNNRKSKVFEQKFTLPSDVDASLMSSVFNPNGVLVISAPVLLHHGNASRSNNKHSGKSILSGTNNLDRDFDSVMSPSKWISTRTSDEQRSRSPFLSSAMSNFDDNKFESHFDSMRSDSGNGGSKLALSKTGSSNGRNKAAKVKYDENGDGLFKIEIPVGGFKPEELVIKTNGHTIHFEAKQEEKSAIDGKTFRSNSVSQSFTIPPEVDPKTIKSELNKNDILIISAPLPPKNSRKSSNERIIPISKY